MADYPAMPFWTDAYLADTTHLSLEEHGAYLKLLTAAWRRTDCRLPDDDAFLAKTLGVSRRKWRVMKRQMLSFWSHDDDGYLYQKKQKLVRENLERGRRQKQTAQQASVTARRLKNNDNPVAAATSPQTSRKRSASTAAIATKTITKEESSKKETQSRAREAEPPPKKPAGGPSLNVSGLVNPEGVERANDAPPERRPVRAAVREFTRKGRSGVHKSFAVDWKNPENVKAHKEQIAMQVAREQGMSNDELCQLSVALMNDEPAAWDKVEELYQIHRLTVVEA